MNADARGYEENSLEHDRDKMNGLSEQIIGGAYAVANKLGHGFLEKPYENALAHELRKRGLAVEQQPPIKIMALLLVIISPTSLSKAA